tara:strand:- start:349 stop:585 length:237 start_codon:yes stop_codon:yes gene_type:complete
LAGCVGTIVHVNFAVDPLVPEGTYAAVTGHFINAYAAVKTGFLGTVVCIRLAILTDKAFRARTRIAGDPINTDATVET